MCMDFAFDLEGLDVDESLFFAGVARVPVTSFNLSAFQFPERLELHASSGPLRYRT